MQIIKDQKITIDDWQHLDVDSDIANIPSGKLIAPLVMWNEAKEAISDKADKVGVRLTPDADLNEIAADLDKLPLIAIEFPAFRDGRGYSLARRLREHYKYTGEIRAVGNVLRDQVGYMTRVGFNAFEIDSKQNVDDALQAFDEISVKYQASSDEALPFYRRRA